MEEDFSEEAIKKNCPHCQKDSIAFEFLLQETPNFSIVCDANPLVEGHLLVIPKRHVSSVGEFTDDELKEFLKIYEYLLGWIKKEYGSVASFEHGKIGQTVFHSHVHMLPFFGLPIDIVPEGLDKLSSLRNLSELQTVFKGKGQYLFFSIGDNKYLVDCELGNPRFFRDRFAKALGRPERGDWKEMRKNTSLLSEAREENKKCINKYSKFEDEL